MDQIYSDLLKSGKSQRKRHYELTGTLAEIEASQNAAKAKENMILSLPTAIEMEQNRDQLPKNMQTIKAVEETSPLPPPTN